MEMCGSFASEFKRQRPLPSLSRQSYGTGHNRHASNFARRLSVLYGTAQIPRIIYDHHFSHSRILVMHRPLALLRHLRGLKGWITDSEVTGSDARTYAGEGNATHGGVDMGSVSKVSHRALTEAFDEPLTRAQVMAIVSPFIRRTAATPA